MAHLESRRSPIRFGVFELDLESGELRKQGRRVRLQEQPFRILALLVARPAQLVSREEIREALWPDGVTVDFDHSVNKAINKLREVLGDAAESPRYIETLPRRGYRFICPVQTDGPTSERPNSVPAAEAGGVQPDTKMQGTTPPQAATVGGMPTSVARAGSAWARVGVGVAVVAALVVVAVISVDRTANVPPRAAERIMLAILPFRGVPDNPDQEYFVDGLTEELIAQVGRVRPDRLGVIAATSAQRYKGTTKPVSEIARELSVDYLLDGSVRRDAGRVRITGQLVKASDQTQVWADTFERDLEDVFDIQRDVAERVAQGLTLELLNEPARATGVSTQVAEAHEQYLRGRFAYAQRTRESLLSSIDHFKQASAADPRFALAHVGMADSYNLMAEYGYLSPREAFPLSKAAASTALDIAPELAEAHANLAWAAYIYDRDFVRSEQGFRRSVALNPGYASTHQWYAGLLRAQARHVEADEHVRRAQELDPVSPIIQSVAGWHDYLARRFDRSVEQCIAITRTSPEFPRVYSYLGWSYLKAGRSTEAIAAFEKALALSGQSAARRAELAHGYASVGQAPEANRLLEQLLADESREYVEPDLIARIYVALGDFDRAFAWLSKAREDGAVKLVLAGVDPVYDPIRSDPRFTALLRTLSLDPDRYAGR